MYLCPPPPGGLGCRSSKVVVLLLYIYCLMYFPLFVGEFRVCLCFVMHYFVSIIVLPLS